MVRRLRALDGAEAPLVDIEVTWAAGTNPPEPVTVEWPNARLQVTAAGSGRDFGMFRARMPAPGFDAVTDVSLHVGDDTHRRRITPCRRWTVHLILHVHLIPHVHLISHVHLDLGFTDTQGKVLERPCRNSDRALDRIAPRVGSGSTPSTATSSPLAAFGVAHVGVWRA